MSDEPISLSDKLPIHKIKRDCVNLITTSSALSFFPLSMAASATTLSSSFSSLSIHSSTFYKQTLIPTTSHFFSTKFHHKPLTSTIASSYSSSSSSSSFPPEEPRIPKPEEIETIFYENQYSEEDLSYEPPPRPDGYMPTPAFDQLPPETEDEVTAAYEELYGPAYSGVSVLGNDVNIMASKIEKKSDFLTSKRENTKDEFEERVVQVRRVTKVVKGGKQMNFRAVVIVGDREGRVGVGVGKAKEVISAVRKAATDARRHVITVPMTKYSTFPHRADGDYGAARVMLRPAADGTGVIAGASVRVVLEMAGIKNALGKQIRSKNALNNARATLVAIQKMRQFSEVAEQRGIPMEELWK